MVLFNYATRELTAKIVFYGPGLCGKTTNLQYVYENLPEDVKGKMLSLATKTDRTLFFDFLPMDLGEIRGMRTRVQLYTVPGQVFYNETRKLVLKGADGIVFVADSQEQMMSANAESFRNLEENLKAHGVRLSEIPHVIQYNKRDLPRLSSLEDLNANVNKYNAPYYEAVATTGIGVQDTLKGIAKLVLLNLTRRYQPGASDRPAPAPKRAPAAAPRAADATDTLPRAAAAKHDKPAEAVAAVPVSSLAVETVSASGSNPPPPSLLDGAVPGREAGMGSFKEVEIDDAVGGLRDSGHASGGGEDWSGDAGDGDDGYFLGEVGTDTPADDAAVVLTEVADDGNLFESPSLEVARMAPGSTREIVVPVEIGEGDDVRRFKLSVKLHLEPLD